MENNEKQNKAWIVTVNMGYGHQRTAYPLRDLSANDIINANTYEGIPKEDKNVWETSRKFYEFISNFKRVPLIGNWFFSLFNKFQEIFSYYPSRDLSRSNMGLRKIYSLIEGGWGKNLIKTLSGNPLPIVSTFFVLAFMAEEFGYPNKIYCVVCDADIARSWAPLDPIGSNIHYFAPCSWVKDRLKLYGVKEENIHLTGYPLPKTNVGDNADIVRTDLSYRLLNLDPKKEYYKRYSPVVIDYIGKLPEKSDHPLTLMFSIGGAGAHKELAIAILKSLKRKIKAGEMKVIISVGIKRDVKEMLIKDIAKINLQKEIDKNVEILFSEKIEDYFDKFNQKLRKTDILWTKPSELSFYAGLGLPIIIAPSIGSQEDLNRKWLLHIGAGFSQDNPKYTDQWLFDLLDGGRLAEGAMQGFVEIEKMGTYNIEKIVSKQ